MTKIIDTTTALTNIAPARRYVVATTGASPSNSRLGSWCSMLTAFDGETVRYTKTFCGAKLHTTNAEMELTAAINALAWLPANDVPAVVQSNSQYLIIGMDGRRHGWMANNSRASAGRPAKIRELWQALIAAVGDRTVTWEWVRGHSGHEEK